MAHSCPQTTASASSSPSAGAPAAALASLEAGARSLHAIVTIAQQRQVDEIHLGAGERPRFRENGDLHPTDWPITEHEDIDRMLSEILSDAQLRAFNEQNQYIGGHDFGFARARINLFQSERERSISVRLIRPRIPTFSQGFLPPEIDLVLERRGGLILVTGPGRSGKTTAIAALADHINRREARHILMFEDPITFVHHGDRSLIRQRDLHLHTRSFAQALKASLREDADVIVIDEILNREMLSAATEASLNGQLVIASLQTHAHTRTVDRVLSLYTPEEYSRIRRAMTQALLAEIKTQGGSGARGQVHPIGINRQAYRDYRPPQRVGEERIQGSAARPARTRSFATKGPAQPLL